ncbi:MAG: ribosome maturation factor [Chitinophagaceae bacterium]|nr:ribosome maturation factor [Chitinophagaceae bacterium]MCW5925634.1 ribosome maturation factor [Chitinophagaceae bacterium]
MSSEATIKIVEELITDLLTDSPDCFLVEVKVKPTNNIRVFLDADGGISLAKCITYNRALYKQIEEKGLFPAGDFSLEVSSPGLDEPLKLKRQYKKNVGRNVEVVLLDGSRIEGKLTTVGEEEMVVEETRGKNKKKEVVQHTIFFNNIKTTKIQIQF